MIKLWMHHVYTVQVCKMPDKIKEAKAKASLYFDYFYSTLFSRFPDWVSGMATLEDM